MTEVQNYSDNTSTILKQPSDNTNNVNRQVQSYSPGESAAAYKAMQPSGGEQYLPQISLVGDPNASGDAKKTTGGDTNSGPNIDASAGTASNSLSDVATEGNIGTNEKAALQELNLIDTQLKTDNGHLDNRSNSLAAASNSLDQQILSESSHGSRDLTTAQLASAQKSEDNLLTQVNGDYSAASPSGSFAANHFRVAQIENQITLQQQQTTADKGSLSAQQYDTLMQNDQAIDKSLVADFAATGDTHITNSQELQLDQQLANNTIPVNPTPVIPGDNSTYVNGAFDPLSNSKSIFNSDFANGGLDQFKNGGKNSNTTASGIYTASNAIDTTTTDPLTGKPINVADLFITPDPNAPGKFYAGQIATKDTLPTDKPYVVEAEMKLTDTGGSAGGFWGSNPAETVTNGSKTQQIGSWLNEIDGPEYLTNGQSSGSDPASDGNLFYSIHQGVPNTMTTHVVENVNNILKDEPKLADGQTETLQNSFHNYAVQVNPNTQTDTFFFDGKQVFTTQDAHNYAPENWIINADIGGNWQGNAHNNNGPFGPANGTEVEYMRAFQQES